MMKIKGRINKYIEDYKFNSLLFKNFMLLLCLIMVPLIGAVVLSYYAYSNMQKNEINTYSEKIVSDAYSDQERILNEARTELMYIGLNSNVELYMYDKEINQLNYKVSTIQELMKMPILTKKYVDSVAVYSVKSSRVITQQGVAHYEAFRRKEDMDRYLEQEGERKSLFVTEDDLMGYTRQQISIFQEIKYGSNLSGLAVMNIDIESLLEELNLPEHVEIYLTDEETILLSNRTEIIGKPVAEMEGYKDALHDGTVQYNDFSISCKYAPVSGLEVVTKVSMEGYHNQLSAIRTFILSLLTVMVLITLVLSILISLRIFSPIEKIIASIRKYRSILIGEEDLFREKDELEYILHSIQESANVKKDVDNELAERVSLLKKAQAVALQSQINPHFLNNTLDTINWTAISLLGGWNEISEMTGALSRMLRMTLENSDTIVPMSTEIEHCTYYLQIQKKRYEDRFGVNWDIPQEVKECKTIRIILQPIVENAIYHGLKPLTHKGILKISGSLKDGQVEIAVEDNGLGMTSEELAQLQKNMKSNMIRESRHIGIANVNQRIKLYFGDEYGIFIESQEGGGTCVRIRFPQILQ